MSRTSFFNRIKPRKKGPQPRSREVLTERYSQLCAKAGELQYRIKVQEQELADLNREMQELNNEAFLASKLEKPKVNEGPGPTLQDAPETNSDNQPMPEGA